MSSGLEDFSIFDLFRMEAEEQVRVLQAELLAVESGDAGAVRLEALMRASHSLKGAARIVGLDGIVALTHAMEDRFVAAQNGRALDSADIDRMLSATDWLARLQATPEAETAAWLEANMGALTTLAATLTPSPEAEQDGEGAAQGDVAFAAEEAVAAPPEAGPAQNFEAPAQVATVPDDEEEDIFAQGATQAHARGDRHVRISAERFDQLISLASETLVAAQQLATLTDELDLQRRSFSRALQTLEDASASPLDRPASLRELDRVAAAVTQGIADLDFTARVNERVTGRLYRSILAGRLRPFSEGITGVQRLVRDTARDLGKKVRLEVLGDRTRVDRDILERLEAPISHLMTNAIDHGIETPDERLVAGKTPEATLRLHARHENGRLVITVRDDGRGIDRDRLRETVVRRGLVNADTAAGLADAELLEFLFLPGFSTRSTVSTVSGRGVGLNVVQSMVQEAGGSVVVTSEHGEGTVFRMTLPITRSVLKVITVQVEGEVYAIPLMRIDKVGEFEAAENASGQMVLPIDDREAPVVPLASLLGFARATQSAGPITVILYQGVAFAVDRLIDEVELSVRRLDPRLGKIPGVSAASLDENGVPLLILDMDDLLQNARGLSSGGAAAEDSLDTPHILVVDDSHTVREMERRLLVRAGYRVSTAQNGLEAWNLLRLNKYDLLVSDVDMPQMNGIELVMKVRENPRLAQMPVIILSYKDREEDRRRGLDAGADFYLTKGDFQNDKFRQAVVDLIGNAEPAQAGPA